jgi:hypothetical protein
MRSVERALDLLIERRAGVGLRFTTAALSSKRRAIPGKRRKKTPAAGLAEVRRQGFLRRKQLEPSETKLPREG